MAGKKRTSSSDAVAAAAELPAKKNNTTTDYASLSFDSDASNKSGCKWNLKISSWNVDGLRACIKKDGIKFIQHENPDIICLQEIKCSKDKLPTEIKNLEGYPHKFWLPAEKDGYSGVALLSKQKPLDVTYGFENGKEGKQFDDEGRLITAEYEKFFLVTTYVPNAGAKLVTLPKRMQWDPMFRNHCSELDKKKPVIICGDLNVAHTEIDLANPKTNKKSAGFTQEERDSFGILLEAGFVDTFRHFYPDQEKAFTFWTYMSNARAKNVGWRLDYFLVSKRAIDDHVCDNVIRKWVSVQEHTALARLFPFEKKSSQNRTIVFFRGRPSGSHKDDKMSLAVTPGRQASNDTSEG